MQPKNLLISFLIQSAIVYFALICISIFQVFYHRLTWPEEIRELTIEDGGVFFNGTAVGINWGEAMFYAAFIALVLTVFKFIKSKDTTSI